VELTNRGAAVYADNTHLRETTVGAGLSKTSDGTYTGEWADPYPTSGTLAKRLEWIYYFTASGSSYTIELNANETIEPTTLSYDGQTVKITLIGADTERKVILSSKGSLFTVGSGVTLVLDDKVTLKGIGYNGTNYNWNTVSLVRVNSGATLAMKGTAKITGNEISEASFSYNGGGVYVDGGSFTMSGSATVSGNSVSYTYGGGVYVNDGSFTMSDNAAVSGNTVNNSNGGGVYVNHGSFIMSGSATISGNTAGYGGGVQVYGGSFTMSDNATISGNRAYDQGGGVYVRSGGSFTKTGGIIYGKTETNIALQNMLGLAVTNEGVAVYVDAKHRRETTVSADQKMIKSGSTYTYTANWMD
jgi:hypothetical protein